jgi:ADP-ribosylglycohydrolase
MSLSADYIASRAYEERVYAGVLGKIIGVYLGRPFEGWHNDKIEKELGEVDYYVHDRLNAPLIVTDDDISGTFTFVRALAENGNDRNLTAAQIGDWWLNSIVEERTILWWGGIAQSTEHTAFLRLKAGYKAPESGSIALNSKVVAEQIGAQIFIDGWGMVAPGDPELAAHFARLAASVSHDGEAIYGAQVIAAMEALAFVEPDMNKLLDTALTFIPKDCTITRLIGDIREWAAANGDDWRATFRKIQGAYGYDKFVGNCHMVPNHAVIMLGLLHGNDDFQRAQMITNTAGWDTDCNAANVGCLMGIKNGLAGIDAGPDWRGPVADRLYIAAADGGRCISDAVREAYELVNSARALAGIGPAAPKDGARFHFSLPGSVQGFTADRSAAGGGAASIGNVDGRLNILLDRITAGRAARVGTPTFVPPDALTMGGYGVLASPTLYSGQTVTVRLAGDADLTGPLTAALFVRYYESKDKPALLRAEPQAIGPNTEASLTWTVPDTEGKPIFEVGIELASGSPVSGCVSLDTLTWTGAPNTTLDRPKSKEDVRQRAWVDGVSQFNTEWVTEGMAFRVVQNNGAGVVSQGESSWTGYRAECEAIPRLGRTGLAACVQGQRRYVAVVFDADYRVRLIEQRDTECRVLAESDMVWEPMVKYSASISVTDDGISARVGNAEMTGKATSARGAVGMVADTGHAEFSAIRITPA